MDFRETCNFFGGSIFVEEPRGDFKSSEERIQEREANINQSSDDEKAACVLLRIVHSALVGNIANEDGKPSCQTYLNAFYAENRSRRWLFRLYQLNLEMIDVVDPLDKLEFSISAALWTLSHCGLEAARVSNPSYIFHNPKPENPRHGMKVYEDCCHRLANVKSLAEELRLETVSNYAERLIAEVRQTQGVSDPVQVFEPLKARYAAAGDDVGIAICYVLQADAMISGCFSSPIALNLLPIDGWDYLGSDTSLERHHMPFATSVEYLIADSLGDGIHSMCLEDKVKYRVRFSEKARQASSAGKNILWITSTGGRAERRSPQGVTSHDSKMEADTSSRGAHFVQDSINNWSDMAKMAMALYQEADDLFHHSNAPRGQAMIASRKACLLLTQEVLPEMYWESKEESNLSYIKKLLITACDGFHNAGDVVHLKLTQLHLLLLASEANGDIFKLQPGIGEWGKKSANWIFARQLGLLAFRFGDHLRHACGSTVKARLSYECARFILREIREQWTVYFQLECAMASLSLALNDIGASKIALDIAGIIFTQLALELDIAAEKEPLWKEAKHFFNMVLIDLKISASQRLDTAEVMRESCHRELKALEDDALGEGKQQQYDTNMNGLREWFADKRRVIDAHVSGLEYEEHMDRGTWDLGRSKVMIHLMVSASTEVESLDVKLARVDLLLKLERFEEVHQILSTIDGNGVLNEFRVGLAFEYGDLTPLYERRQTLRAMESVLERCINSQFWSRARHFQILIEKISPDHFLFPGNYSHILPWQRALWLGLIEESQGITSHFYSSFFQSWALFHSEWLNTNTVDFRNALVNHKDFDRIAVSIARFYRRMNSLVKESRVVPQRPAKDDQIRFVRSWNRSVNMADWDLQAEALGALERGKALSVAQSVSAGTTTDTHDIAQYDKTRYRFRLWLDLASLRRPRTEAEEEEYQVLNNSSLEEELKTRPLVGWDKRPLGDQVLGYPALLTGLPKDALVIYIALSADGLELYGIDHSGILRCTGQDVRASSTRQMVSRYVGLLSTYKDEAPEEELGNLAWSMSKVFIQPLEDLIRAKEQILFVPSGDLARFPLGVLLFENEPLGLQKPVSQVPSLSALVHLSLRRVAGTATISAITRPGSPKEAQAGGPSALPMAGIEALLIGQQFGITPLSATEVSKEDFYQEMERCHIMHLSTHGHFDEAAPLLS
ncbi:MAG: hypothetical protein Q9191_007448, partial [Dirinaria sp. TL-2023a]